MNYILGVTILNKHVKQLIANDAAVKAVVKNMLTAIELSNKMRKVSKLWTGSNKAKVSQSQDAYRKARDLLVDFFVKTAKISAAEALLIAQYQRQELARLIDLDLNKVNSDPEGSAATLLALDLDAPYGSDAG